MKKEYRKIKDLKFLKRWHFWWKDKIREIRKVTKPQAKRLQRLTKKFGSLGVILFLLFLLVLSYLFPKSEIQKLKEELIKNPNRPELQLILTEKLLANNQFKKAEKILRLAEKFNFPNLKINQLWQQKHYSDPEDIKKLINGWERILEKYPNYRDGWLQLAVLTYKNSQEEKTKESLKKALSLDPNYLLANELEKIILR
ncbi:MAG: hypothetical protein ACPLKP_03655 [Microgenomates group bacterium]